MPSQDYGEPWRPGFGYNSIITDRVPEGISHGMHKADESYGGLLVAEGFSRDMMLRACACVNAMQGLPDGELGAIRAIVAELRRGDGWLPSCNALRFWAERNGYVKVVGHLAYPPTAEPG